MSAVFSNSRKARDASRWWCCCLPATTALIDLVALARRRWPIEQQYRELKDDLRLDHCEGRSFHGWAHHVVLTAVAFTFLQLERGRDEGEPRPTLPVVRGWVREIMGLLYVLHNRRLLRMLDSLVMAGIPPAKVLVAATRTTAQIIGQDDLGMVAPGKSADFVVLDANPLDDITNTRRISKVFLRGREINREALRARLMSAGLSR